MISLCAIEQQRIVPQVITSDNPQVNTEALLSFGESNISIHHWVNILIKEGAYYLLDTLFFNHLIRAREAAYTLVYACRFPCPVLSMIVFTVSRFYV